MMKSANRIAVVGLLILFTGCCNLEYYQVPAMPGTDTPIKNPTSLNVMTGDKSSVTDDINVFLLSEDGGEVKASFNPNTTVDVEAGKYLILKVSEELEDAKLETHILTLPVSDSRAIEGFVESAPNVHAAHKWVTLDANMYHEHEMVLAPYTRTVRFLVDFYGVDKSAVTSVHYELTGVNHTVDLLKDFGNGGSTGNCTLRGELQELTIHSDGSLSGLAEARILGLDFTVSQELTVSVTLVDGTVMSITLDVNALLKDFYRMEPEDMVDLKAILSFGLDDDVTGSVEGWISGWDEDLKGE